MQQEAAHLGKLQFAIETCHLVSLKTDEVALFFSGGKDSICLLDIMHPHFKKIYLVNMYFVKGLQHIDKYMNYALSKYSNTEQIQVEHWIMSYIRNSGKYCIPNYSQKLIKLTDIDNTIRETTGVQYTFYGMKKADSLNRNLMLRQYERESISKTGKIYPLSQFKNKDVLAYIRLNKLPIPISYNSKKQSQGVFFNEDVFLYLRNNYPNDLQLIYNQFPQSKQILFEHDYENRSI